MFLFKQFFLPAWVFAGFLLLFAGCGDDDQGLLVVQLAAETVNCETTTDRIVTVGEQRPFAAAIVSQSGDSAWCSFEPFASGASVVLEKSGTVGIPLIIYLARNESDEDRSATIVVGASGQSVITLTLRQLAYSPTAFFDRQWGEQPAYQKNEDYTYKTYYTTLTRGGRVRNYSICFDTKKRVSHWVAYPLTTNYVEPSVVRTNRWAYDPNNQQPAIPQSEQSNVVRAFGRDAARGHQCPSADRYSNEATNAMTFYATNIMPQNHDFNEDIWAKLEKKVRDNMGFFRQDTIFVVTGTYFSNDRTITDASGNEVAYPSHCWKVLLRSSGRRAVWESSADQLYGIGFWFANDASNTGPLSRYSTSIADIEQKTGFTFFRNIPADAAAQVKAQHNPTDWSI